MIVFFNILKFIILIIVTFLSCQVITDKNKRISYIGTILICFSTAIVEYINNGLVEAIIFGELIFISIDKFFCNTKYSVLWLLLIPFQILGFLLMSNISFQIPIGICMITLIIWRLLDFKKSNKEKNDNKKINNKVIILFCILLLISSVIGVVFYKYNPIKKLEDKSGINYIFDYTYGSIKIFNQEIKYENNSCLSTFISIFPIGLFIIIYYIFKDETKHMDFIIPTCIISILELIIIFSNIKIFFLPNYIFILGFNLLQIYMIIYIFSRINEKMFSLTKSAYISLIGLVILLFFPIPNGLNKSLIELSYIIFVIESYILLNYSDRRFWRLASWFFTIICFIEFFGYIIVKIQG